LSKCVRLSQEVRKEHDELTLQSKICLASIFHLSNRGEEGTALIAEMKKALLDKMGPSEKYAEALIMRVAPNCFEEGLYHIAIDLYDSGLALMSTFPVPENREKRTERFGILAEGTHSKASSLIEIGRTEEAKELIRGFHSRLESVENPRGILLPLCRSKYMITQQAFLNWIDRTPESEEFNPDRYYDFVANTRTPLPENAFFVAKFDILGSPSVVEISLKDSVKKLPSGETSISFRSESLPSTSKGYFLSQIDIYSDSSKSTIIGTHLQYFLSLLDSDTVHTRSDFYNQMMAH